MAFYDYSLYAATLSRKLKKKLFVPFAILIYHDLNFHNKSPGTPFWLKLFVDPSLKATDLENKYYANVFYRGQHLR